MDSKHANIKMFSGFEMDVNDVILTDETLRSNMILKLLVYMLCNRKNIINANELSEVLWKEDESDNPIGALKNLMYRLRTILSKNFDNISFIKTLRGSYAWDQDLDIVVNIDVEEFEQYYKNSKLEIDSARKCELLEKALALYTGPFLPKFNGEHWIMQLSAYYHSIYITCVIDLAKLFDKDEQYEKLEEICNKALQQEELDERIHCFLMKALLRQGKKKEAEGHYKRTSQLLYSQLGTKPSVEMMNFHRELLKEIKAEEMNLNIIQGDLSKEKKEHGAYYCEYGVFKEIYQLQARQGKRLGIAVFCGLITIDSVHKIPLDSEAYQRFRNTAMERLNKVILATLRSGDVFTRYSGTQFMILLPTCNYEGGVIVMERIEKAYFDIDTRHVTHLVCALREQELV